MYRLIFISVLLLFSCDAETEINQGVVKFDELVELDHVSVIKVWNNTGKHKVTGKKREELLDIIGNMTLDKNGSYKLGGKSIELTIDGEVFTLLGRTNGNHIEANREIATKNKDRIQGLDVLYFDANGLNIDNF